MLTLIWRPGLEFIFFFVLNSTEHGKFKHMLMKSKMLKNLFIDTSYSLGSSDVITNINTMTPVNTLFFLRKITANTWLFKMKL